MSVSANRTVSNEVSNPAAAAPTLINVTESAAAKVAALIELEDNYELKLRIYIVGGGCSGFQYGFTFTSEVDGASDWQSDHLVTNNVAVMDPADPLLDGNSGDTLVSQDSESQGLSQVTVVIDKISMQYLRGATVDYKNDLDGERFIINNPNAKTSCGCGSSFAV